MAWVIYSLIRDCSCIGKRSFEKKKSIDQAIKVASMYNLLKQVKVYRGGFSKYMISTVD